MSILVRCGTTRSTMDVVDATLSRFLDLLDDTSEETVGTSVRLPLHLREAAGLATQLGLAGSTTDLTVRGLRDTLTAFAQRLILDAHYRDNPEVRPSLAEIALMAAELDGNPLADRPDLIRRAAEGVTSVLEAPSPDDVLVYAAGLAAGEAAA